MLFPIIALIIMTISEELQKELRSQYNPEGSILRKGQLRMLELLKVLDKICRENDLKYWLSGGTLLGAVRHDGFIPWDDDIDVNMPREDAKKLKKLMGNKIFDGFAILQNTSTDPNYLPSSWMTLRDIKSEYVSNDLWHKRQKYKGLQVDIFIVERGVSPKLKHYVDWIHQQLIFRPWVGKKMKYLRWMSHLNHKFFDNILSPILHSLKFNNKITVGYGCIFCNPQNYEDIFPLGKIKFEGIEFNAPANTDAYLTNLFGDYLKLPDEGNRRTDHDFEIKFLE